MSLRAALSIPHRNPRVRCGTAEWIASLSADEQAAAAELLESDRPHTEVLDAFRAEGYLLGYNALLRHRNGVDNCVTR